MVVLLPALDWALSVIGCRLSVVSQSRKAEEQKADPSETAVDDWGALVGGWPQGARGLERFEFLDVMLA